MLKKTVFFFCLFFIFPGIQLDAQNKIRAFDYTKNLEIYANLMKTLNLSYIDSLNFTELNQTAIDALLEKLDPYNVFIPEAEKEKFEYMRTGEYGGVGLAIVKNEHDYPSVSNLMVGQSAEKAGMRIGDKILRIDGRDTREMNEDEMSHIFKGTLGQELVLSVERIGIPGSSDYFLTRQNIKVKNVAFYAMLDHSIAYIALRSFTMNAAEELQDVFLELKKQNPKGLIIDLRGNGGGLITEAVHAINIFVNRDVEIVRTQGKQPNSKLIYRTQHAPIDIDIPLVFLVDEQTASASEIMAGAAQDLDRAVLIGQNTYGKGLVQNVVPLNYDAQVKITIARYLLPSGRRIQKEISKNTEKLFKTLNGRPVVEGEGLTPDIYLTENISDPLLVDQAERLFIFDFASEYYAQKNHPKLDASFEIDSIMMEHYRQFLLKKEYVYISQNEMQIRDLRQQIETDNGPEEVVALLLQAEENQNLVSNKPGLNYMQELKELLRFEILTHQFYREGAAKICIKDDKSIQKAVSVLNDRNAYQALIGTPQQ